MPHCGFADPQFPCRQDGEGFLCRGKAVSFSLPGALQQWITATICNREAWGIKNRSASAPMKRLRRSEISFVIRLCLDPKGETKTSRLDTNAGRNSGFRRMSVIDLAGTQITGWRPRSRIPRNSHSITEWKPPMRTCPSSRIQNRASKDQLLPNAFPSLNIYTFGDSTEFNERSSLQTHCLAERVPLLNVTARISISG